jgi:hypothetical protein
MTKMVLIIKTNEKYFSLKIDDWEMLAGCYTKMEEYGTFIQFDDIDVQKFFNFDPITIIKL